MLFLYSKKKEYSILTRPIDLETVFSPKEEQNTQWRYTKDLEAVGVGYRFSVSGNKVVVSAGYSHTIDVVVPNGITVTSPSNTELSISGFDKQKVSEFAANIRKIREPEPYKGKGIRYKGEHIRRKEGKKAAK